MTVQSVKITGTGSATVILVNGEPVMRCTGFTVRADGPDHITRLILEVDPDDLEIDGDFEVEYKVND
jgi:hypothetical protein